MNYLEIRNKNNKRKITKEKMWSEIDILLTANPALLLDYPMGKIMIKYETEYNKDIPCIHTIKTIKELEDKITSRIDNLNKLVQCINNHQCYKYCYQIMLYLHYIFVLRL